MKDDTKVDVDAVLRAQERDTLPTRERGPWAKLHQLSELPVAPLGSSALPGSLVGCGCWATSQAEGKCALHASSSVVEGVRLERFDARPTQATKDAYALDTFLPAQNVTLDKVCDLEPTIPSYARQPKVIPIKEVKPEPNDRLVLALKRLLAEAESGELIGAVVFCNYPTQTQTYVAGHVTHAHMMSEIDDWKFQEMFKRNLQYIDIE